MHERVNWRIQNPVKPLRWSVLQKHLWQKTLFPLKFYGFLMISERRWRVEGGYPVDTGRTLKVHKTFRRGPGRLLNVLRMFNLRPVSTG